MAGVSVRLTEGLTERARDEARVQDRSLTEQVEHWSRLGQIIETAIAASTMAKLKARSHDRDLDKRIAFARTEDGRARARALIIKRDVSEKKAARSLAATPRPSGRRTRKP